VIADNASTETQVRPLLPGAGPHKVLVTSRHTLAGLGARLTDVTVLDPDAAVAVLEAALEVARPGEERITAHPEAAERLAAACGGLPLALQIVAAVLNADPALTAAELAGQFSDETQRLRALHYDDGSGGLSVASAFELSYRRLDDVSARVFRLLPVSPGPDLSTATAAVLVSLLEAEMRRVLGGLARAHLIETAPGAAGRWRMHDLLRLYAQQLSDQHADADGREQARDQLLDHYGAMADAADKHLRALPGTAVPGQFTGRDDAMAWLDTERISLTAAVSMAAETGRKQEAVYLSLLLAEHLKWRRRFDDWLAVTAIGLAAARHLGYRHGEAMALNNLGNALQQMRRLGEAVTACQDAAAIYRETGDRHGEGGALSNLGIALQKLRRFGEAVTACQDAAAIYRETGDRHGEAVALTVLGLALREVRRFDEAVTACRKAATIYRETGDRHGEGGALSNLGIALQKLRRFGEAVTACQDAAAIYRETGDRHGEAITLTNLGNTLTQMRRFEEAITVHQGAADIFRETQDRHGEAAALANLGSALLEGSQFADAVTACRTAAAICQETGDRHGEAVALNNLGIALRVLERFEEAITVHQGAADIFRETQDRHGEARARCHIGRAWQDAWQFDRAVAAFRDAAALFQEAGDNESERTTLKCIDEIGLARRLGRVVPRREHR
jgi:tetratricopeptide (TPR) repeat protein